MTNVYPNIDENFTATNENVSSLLRVFVVELIKLLLKQNSSLEAIFATTRPRILMPFQLGLTFAVDYEFASKRLITLLYKLEFAVSYDAVSLLVNFNEHTHYLIANF